MKYRLSHRQSGIIELTGLVIGGIVPWAIAIIFIQFIPIFWGALVAILINLLTFYLSLRMYKAEFDADFLYLSRRLNSKKIRLEDVGGLKIIPFPFYVYLGHSYLLSIRYSDDGKQKKAFVLSRGASGWAPTIESIAEIRLFREYFQNKKRQFAGSSRQ
jgi:hypothetical protein